MRIEYKTIDRRSDMYRFIYEPINIIYCCEEMKEVFNKAIIFGEDDTYLNTNHDVNIYYKNWSTEEYPIKFCPFCGEIIEVIEVKRTKLVERKKTITKVETNYVEVDGG